MNIILIPSSRQPISFRLVKAIINIKNDIVCRGQADRDFYPNSRWICHPQTQSGRLGKCKTVLKPFGKLWIPLDQLERPAALNRISRRSFVIPQDELAQAEQNDSSHREPAPAFRDSPNSSAP